MTTSFQKWFKKAFPAVPLNTKTASIAAAAWDEALNRLISQEVAKLPKKNDAKADVEVLV